MSQNNSNDKAAMLAKIEGINEVEGFDPTPFAVDYTDLETGEVRKRLPVMIQMAWFRMKYPEGRIAITVSPGKDCFVATAKVCIDHIMIYEGKRIEVTFAHMQDYEALVSRMKDYYINQREVG